MRVVHSTPETLGDEILRHKAAALRKRTGDERWHAPKETIPFKELYKTALTKVRLLLVPLSAVDCVEIVSYSRSSCSKIQLSSS